MRILLTGGSGLLGKELQKLRTFDWAPTKEQLDITDRKSVDQYIDDTSYDVDLIVHCAAYTKVEQAEIHRMHAYTTNVVGTQNLCRWAPLLYISTEYVHSGNSGSYRETDKVAPRNWYAKTKLWGEKVLACRDKVIRTLFKPRPWPHQRAYIDQYTSGDYVDVIAKEIDLAISKFNLLPPVINIGTGRKCVWDLARQTKPYVGKMSIAEVAADLPRDCSLDTSWWETIKEL